MIYKNPKMNLTTNEMQAALKDAKIDTNPEAWDAETVERATRVLDAAQQYKISRAIEWELSQPCE